MVHYKLCFFTGWHGRNMFPSYLPSSTGRLPTFKYWQTTYLQVLVDCLPSSTGRLPTFKYWQNTFCKYWQTTYLQLLVDYLPSSTGRLPTFKYWQNTYLQVLVEYLPSSTGRITVKELLQIRSRHNINKSNNSYKEYILNIEWHSKLKTVVTPFWQK